MSILNSTIAFVSYNEYQKVVDERDRLQQKCSQLEINVENLHINREQLELMKEENKMLKEKIREREETILSLTNHIDKLEKSQIEDKGLMFLQDLNEHFGFESRGLYKKNFYNLRNSRNSIAHSILKNDDSNVITYAIVYGIDKLEKINFKHPFAKPDMIRDIISRARNELSNSYVDIENPLSDDDKALIHYFWDH
jgi:hypothetical protein